MAGMYFEEFHVGDRFESPHRTVTETDVVYYAGFSGDYNPLHTDREFAANTVFGERIAHGMLGASVAIGLWCRLGVMDGTAMALLESNWKFVGPIRIGDTIHCDITIKETRRLSKPGRGIIHVGLSVVNQLGEVSQEGVLVLMVKARDGQP